MRWVLAGLAFALFVSLAVITVALKVRNLAARARIAKMQQQIIALHVEKARRQPHLRPETSTAELQRRLLELTERGGE